MRGEESDHIRFPAGRYYIGDPCYAIPDHEWMEYLDTYPKHENPHIGWVDGIAVKYKGQMCWQSGTAYGDGSYTGSDGFEYGVDAGIIGIIPVALIEPKEREEIESNELGRIVTFAKPFMVWRDGDGTFHFGDIDIVTDGSDIEEEEEEEYLCSTCANEVVDFEGDECDSCVDAEFAEDDEDEE